MTVYSFAQAEGRHLPPPWVPADPGSRDPRGRPDVAGSRLLFIDRGSCPGPCRHHGCRASRARVVFRWWAAKTDPQFFTPSPQPADFGPGCGEASRHDSQVTDSGCTKAPRRPSLGGLSVAQPRPGPASRLSTSDLHF